MEQPTQSTNETDSSKWRRGQDSQRGEGIFRLSEGWVSNPLHSGRVRNLPCICGSEKKVKKCCGRDPIIRDPRMVYSTEQRHKVGDSKFHEKVANAETV